MYTIRNGVMFRDGVARIALGVSYYASYHPDKYPVPPEGDRYGEMKRDVREMAEAGFDHVRTAAIGPAHWEDDRFVLDSAFTDAMVREISRNNMASFVRLHGYSMNHRGHPGAKPVSHLGQESGPYNGFVQDCLSHEGVRRDAILATRAQAAHFKDLPDMLGFQISNEPAYPYDGFYDYNPLAVEAFRKWLVERGLKTEEEARALTPPTRRPYYDEDPADWIAFRLFGTENMTAMLAQLNEAARQAAPGTESYSCPMPCPFQAGGVRMGEDFFSIAEGTDILGQTQYTPFRGEGYFFSNLVLDGLESAAAIQGKHAWMIEFCCRTYMNVEDYERQAYTALGAGLKGLNYYLWRADQAGPEEQMGGMLWNDRTKTKKFDEAVRMNALINRLSESLALSEKLRSGVAILYSLHAAAYFDAVEGFASPGSGRARWYQYTRDLYAALRRFGVSVDFIRAGDLARNPLQTRLLLIPTEEGLSRAELDQVADFAKTHAVVTMYRNESDAGFRFHPGNGEAWNGHALISDWCFRGNPDRRNRFRLNEVLRIADISPVFRTESDLDALGAGYLAGNDRSRPYYIACLTNIHANNEPVRDGRLIIDEARTGPVTRAVCFTRGWERELSVVRAGGRTHVDLPVLEGTGGCFVRLDAQPEAKGERACGASS